MSDIAEFNIILSFLILILAFFTYPFQLCFWYLIVFLSCAGAFGLLAELACRSGVFGALTSRSHPNSPRGW